MKFTVQIPVYKGVFSSQPLVFAYLLDQVGTEHPMPDFDQIEVIQTRFAARLGAVFAPDISHDLETQMRRAGGDTLVLCYPGHGLPAALAQSKLTLLGQFQGEITRAFI